MEPNRVQLRTVVLSLIAVLVVECLAVLLAKTQLDKMLLIGIARCIEVGLLVGIIHSVETAGVQVLGVHSNQIKGPLLRGVIWSLGFGLAVILAALVVYLIGTDPLRLISTKLPHSRMSLAAFFVVGGLISPIAEEIFFRGVIYGYLRRWGVWAAVGGSTLLFVLAHTPGRGVPLPQLVGGLLFAWSYEKEKNVLVPITIHVLGNLAIFSISIIN